MDDEAKEFTYTLLGRIMRFKYLSSGQIIMMQRMHQRGVKLLEVVGEDKGQVLDALTKLNLQTLDLIESLFLNPEDVEFVQQAMLEGKIGLDDLRPILAGGKTLEPPPDDDADPATPPKALRSKKPATTASGKKTATRRAAR